MRKNNTNDRLFTVDFSRACIANLLRYAAVYMLFPMLPFVMVEQLNISLLQAGSVYLVFAIAMLAVGPFHAYLGDAYKRKSVLLYSTLIMIAASGYAYAQTLPQWLLLAAVQGGCFELATAAGITVAIDITTSTRRSAGNVAYAWAGRLGMLLGVIIGVWIWRMEGFRVLMFLSMICGMLSMLFAARVYVAFRAPIGVGVCNIDRFLLIRGWLPAINALLIAFVPGMLIPLLVTENYFAVPLLVLLTFLVYPFLKMFLKLAKHCQRGTANTTCQLAVEVGLLLGMSVSSYALINACEESVYQFLAGTTLLSALLFVLFTYPYYKKKKVR